MPVTAEINAPTGAELARWLLPLLKEYTEKLNTVCDRVQQTAESYAGPIPKPMELSVQRAARYLASQSTLKRLLLQYASRASALLDHHHFEDDDLKLELTGRWEEAEDAIRSSDLIVAVLARRLEVVGLGVQLNEMVDYIQHGAAR